MICILYTICLSAWLGMVALLVERALPPSAPRRWIWCVVIVLSMTVPAFYQAQHAVALPESLTANASPWAWLQSHDPLVMRLWLAASALLLIWGAVGATRVARVVGRARREALEGSAVTHVAGVPVLVTASAGPATVGLWRARVLIPRWVLGLGPVQRQYVVRHEEEHRRAQDGRLLILSSLLLVLAPWNIALWWQLRRLRLAVEIDCDNRVVRALGDADIYGELLVKVSRAGSRGPRLVPGLTGGAGVLERRLIALVNPVLLSKMTRYVLAAVAVVLLFIALSTPHPVIVGHAATHATHEGSR